MAEKSDREHRRLLRDHLILLIIVIVLTVVAYSVLFPTRQASAGWAGLLVGCCIFRVNGRFVVDTPSALGGSGGGLSSLLDHGAIPGGQPRATCPEPMRTTCPIPPGGCHTPALTRACGKVR